jgi:hypothetical protein
LASFSVQILERIWDLPERRPQLFEQTLTGVSHRNAARRSVQ